MILMLIGIMFFYHMVKFLIFGDPTKIETYEVLIKNTKKEMETTNSIFRMGILENRLKNLEKRLEAKKKRTQK